MTSARPARRFVGIDLGGGRGKNTAVARLELGDDGRLTVAEAKIRYGQRGTGAAAEPPGDALFRDDVLADYIERWVDEHTVVAIDAPLTLPPCVRCTLPCPGVGACEVDVVRWMRTWAPKLRVRGRSDPSKPAVTPYTQRATEVLWAAAGVRPREALGQGSGPLTARAAHLRRRFSPKLRLHENLLEVHPRVTLAQLFGEADERRTRHGTAESVWEARKRLLGELREGVDFDYVWPEVVVRNTHLFHAVICSYTGYLWATRGWSGPADFADAEGDRSRQGLADAASELGGLWLEDGWVFAPPRRES